MREDGVPAGEGVLEAVQHPEHVRAGWHRERLELHAPTVGAARGRPAGARSTPGRRTGLVRRGHPGDHGCTRAGGSPMEAPFAEYVERVRAQRAELRLIHLKQVQAEIGR